MILGSFQRKIFVSPLHSYILFQNPDRLSVCVLLVIPACILFHCNSTSVISLNTSVLLRQLFICILTYIIKFYLFFHLISWTKWFQDIFFISCHPQQNSIDTALSFSPILFTGRRDSKLPCNVDRRITRHILCFSDFTSPQISHLPTVQLKHSTAIFSYPVREAIASIPASQSGLRHGRSPRCWKFAKLSCIIHGAGNSPFTTVSLIRRLYVSSFVNHCAVVTLKRYFYSSWPFFHWCNLMFIIFD